jgi:hypothetical protein
MVDVGTRTLCTGAECPPRRHEMATGFVSMRTESGCVCIRVRVYEKDFPRARDCENGRLIEPLLFRDGSVVYARLPVRIR